MYSSSTTSSVRTGDKVIATVNLRGIIQESETENFAKQEINFQNMRPLLEQAFAVPEVIAVVLQINCPGGAPTQTKLVADFIRKKADATNKQVFAIVEDVAASGGYWLACAADEIFVDPNSMVGSVGVIAQTIGVTGALSKIGVEPRVITSVKNKAGMNPLVEMTPEAEKLVKENMMVIHRNFTRWVRKRRKNIKDEDEEEVLSGRVYVGQKAVDVGLADKVASLAEVLQEKYPDDYEDLKLVEVKRKFEGGLLRLLGQFFSNVSRLSRLLKANPAGGLPILSRIQTLLNT